MDHDSVEHGLRNAAASKQNHSGGQPLDEAVEESLRENREAIRRLATL